MRTIETNTFFIIKIDKLKLTSYPLKTNKDESSRKCERITICFYT